MSEASDIERQQEGILGALVGCYLIGVFAVAEAGSPDNAFAMLFILMLMPFYWLGMVTSWCAALPDWFVPITAAGAVAWVAVFIGFAARRRWGLALLLSCAAFHLSALTVAEVLTRLRIPPRAAEVPGERVSYRQVSALSMMQNGTRLGLRGPHAVLITDEHCYLWSFFEDRFVVADGSGQCW